MTAKDALQNSLWNSLPRDIKNTIQDKVRNGQTDAIVPANCVYSQKDRDVCVETLTKLGYNANLLDGKFVISWATPITGIIL